ncbi:hypothetical protein AU210_013627 [Fusarium oxysporum f. sp. radicis-cucumerinum]|uniref:Uncharacterized protein n=2 Tax=Fusarium oxysporum TaxID=5507 RepID=A0A2H3G986_FUSOX|nr:hypothetical protein AU210_013627 [Fusarium oxysporum f. sp. radicis-cucumerinum]
MSRYAAAHANPQGPGDARPTALQIIKDEDVEGSCMTRSLSSLAPPRNLAKAQEALAGIFDPSRMELVEMDQESLDSVRLAANSILAKTDKINILVNNAGIMAV